MDIYLFPCYTKEKGAIQMTAECRNWQEEFMDVNFVDQRLKTRFFKIMDLSRHHLENPLGLQPGPEVLQKQHTVSFVIEI